ncbi:nucleotidyl cyclase domain-containing protein [Hydrogenothermus marinus]|uniref:GGDEF domain-containing protein n=1 Tax=Hydrogenothermus marinus TaxID=133270 RepID=A0A3M0BFL4_9AQUI|nr:hypothetical protein [Hydrogenothermus marinus]RMA96100.1 hypothetical protein CLV39_1112 [Hydrogenothermus marinus]
MSEKLNIYDFDVFKALVEIEIRRNERYKEPKYFSIAFLYAPNLVKEVENNESLKDEIAFKIKDDIRSSDVITPVEEDFLFLFFPDTTQKEAKKVIDRIKKNFNFEIIEGIASFPEDGNTPYQLFTKLVNIMNEKLIPVIEFDLE